MKKAERLNLITDKIIGIAIDVHRELGPGLLESAYEACMEHDLIQRDLKVERQKSLPVTYKGLKIDCGYRLDLLVENEVIVELKSVETLLPIHKAQVMTYLKLFGCNVALLINFNVRMLKAGINRIVYNFPSSPRSLRSLR
jgi:GxxExxY protein